MRHPAHSFKALGKGLALAFQRRRQIFQKQSHYLKT
jgi:hypothetical protein